MPEPHLNTDSMTSFPKGVALIRGQVNQYCVIAFLAVCQLKCQRMGKWGPVTGWGDKDAANHTLLLHSWKEEPRGEDSCQRKTHLGHPGSSREMAGQFAYVFCLLAHFLMRKKSWIFLYFLCFKFFNIKNVLFCHRNKKQIFLKLCKVWIWLLLLRIYEFLLKSDI